MPTQHPRRIRLAAIQAVRTVGTRSFATRSERVPVVQPECENRQSRLLAKIANTVRYYDLKDILEALAAM